MFEFIITYWLEALFGAMLATMGVWIKKLQNKLKQQDAVTEGLKAILHDMLFQLCEKYLALGYIPVEESEEVLTREKVIYDAYSGLHGNSTGSDVHKNFRNLPIKKQESV